MRIGINARSLQGSRSGIAQYVYYLLLYLRKVDKKNEYTLFLGSSNYVFEDIANFEFLLDISDFPTKNQFSKIVWQHLYLPLRMKELRIDVFHEPAFVAPYFKKCPAVITIHDLSYKLLPNCYTLRNRLYLERLTERSISLSDKIIAISENTKKDILQNYKIKEEKIKVIYEGVDEVFHPMADLKEEASAMVKAKYGISGNFILMVSLISPRKNMVNLIKAFSLLKKKGAADHQLVIVGKKGWFFEEVFREAENSNYSKDIIFCDFVSRYDLVTLYNAADVFVYPSLYEGFGLPLLEAMACNCPVVASDCSSIPEVCSDAAILVDPLDPGAFAEAISQVINNRTLRESLIEKGRLRINNFSWEKTARETIDLYNSLRR
jgi:glycosyltransferase involved in cell wall biosynthesis